MADSSLHEVGTRLRGSLTSAARNLTESNLYNISSLSKNESNK